jgi:hypothetical protein
MNTSKCIRNVTMDLDYLTKIWTPNTCVVNSKTATIHHSPSPNVFLILYRWGGRGRRVAYSRDYGYCSDGTVWKNCRMMVTSPCNMDLRKFPFDTQSCTLTFESYSYNTQKVLHKWNYTVHTRPWVGSSEMARVGTDYTHENPQFTRFYIDQNGSQAQFRRVSQRIVASTAGMCGYILKCLYFPAVFTFKRRSGFFILQAYVPTYMTIFVAWINFWMDPRDQLATRATLSECAHILH